MAPALLYIAAWSIITYLSIYFRGASATDLDLQFIIQPHDVVLAKGTSVLLNCSASSSLGEVNITWLKDGIVLRGNKRLQIKQTGSLLLKRVKTKIHEGQYSCLASDYFGTIISKASVKIAYLDDFTKEPTSLTSSHGENVRFECSIKGNPLPQIQWKKGNQDLPDTNKFFTLNSGVLQIFNVDSSDAGSYFCIAKNIAGTSVSEEALLTVLPQGNELKPVEILSHPVNVTAKSWAEAVLECFAVGNPKPSISWLKDGKPLTPQMNHEIIQGNLVLKAIQFHDSGNYTCIASTETANKTQHVQLKVFLSPFLEDVEPESVWDRPTSSVVRFTCTFNGVPNPRIEWYHNGELMQEVDRVKFTNERQTVVVQQSQPSDSGYFQCWGINEAGVVKGSTSLYVRPPDDTAPDPPVIEECRAVSDKTVSLTWKAAPPKQGQGSVFYSVHYKTGDDELQIVREETNCIIDNLYENTEYSIYIMAYNDGGPSRHSETCTVITGPNHIVLDTTSPKSLDRNGLPVPSNLQLAVVSPTSLNVSWNYKMSLNAVIDTDTVLQFRVRYKAVFLFGNIDHTVDQGEVLVASTSTVLNNLKPYRHYQIEVRAEIGMKISMYSDTQKFVMPQALPSAPRHLNMDEMGDGWVSLRWQPPEEINGNLKFYVVSYSSDTSLPDAKWDIIQEIGSVTQTAVRGLKAGVAYHFKVAAVTGGGTGPSTPTLTIQTTTSPTPGDRDKGIIVGVSIGVSCIIICIIIVLLRNRCCASPTHHTAVLNSHAYPHSNGSVPNGHGPHRRGLVHQVDGSFQEIDSYLPMLSPHVPPNHDLDTKGGYDTYPRMVERVHLIKGMNGFTSGGRTRTVSSGYTSDRDFDQVDEGIPLTHRTMTVGTQSEGEPTDSIYLDTARLDELDGEDARSSGVPSSNLDSLSNHSLCSRGCHGDSGIGVVGSHGGSSFCVVTPQTNTGSWSSSSRNSSNKDSGTGTECLMGSSYNPDEEDGRSRGSSNTITLGELGSGCDRRSQSMLNVLVNHHTAECVNNTATMSTSDGCCASSLVGEHQGNAAVTTSSKPPSSPQLPAFDSGEHHHQNGNSNVNNNNSNNGHGRDNEDRDNSSLDISLSAALKQTVNNIDHHKSQQPPQPQITSEPEPPREFCYHHNPDDSALLQNASSATRVIISAADNCSNGCSSSGTTTDGKTRVEHEVKGMGESDSITTSTTASMPSRTITSREKQDPHEKVATRHHQHSLPKGKLKGESKLSQRNNGTSSHRKVPPVQDDADVEGMKHSDNSNDNEVTILTSPRDTKRAGIDGLHYHQPSQGNKKYSSKVKT